jgi:hypothetical protein
MTADTAERELSPEFIAAWNARDWITQPESYKDIAWRWWQKARAALPARAPDVGTVHRIEHDGFQGEVIGSYRTREGKEGVVLQQIGTKVVDVYGRKWLSASPPPPEQGGEPSLQKAQGSADAPPEQKEEKPDWTDDERLSRVAWSAAMGDYARGDDIEAKYTAVAKALEWDPFRARTPFGDYSVSETPMRDGLYGTFFKGRLICSSFERSLAKDAAQADCEYRARALLSPEALARLSALTQPAPAPVAGGEAVAVRCDFDGDGWRYLDGGSGSDWRTRYPNAEALYTTSDAELEALRERCAKAAELYDVGDDLNPTERGYASGRNAAAAFIRTIPLRGA